jgi:chromosome segregation ATPase
MSIFGNGKPEEPKPSSAERLARKAAEAHQEVLDLHDEVQHWKGQAQAWERQASLAEGERDQLRTENQQLRYANEQLHDRHLRIDERINQAGSLVLSCADLLRGAKGISEYAPKPPDERKLVNAVKKDEPSLVVKEQEDRILAGMEKKL